MGQNGRGEEMTGITLVFWSTLIISQIHSAAGNNKAWCQWSCLAVVALLADIAFKVWA